MTSIVVCICVHLLVFQVHHLKSIRSVVSHLLYGSMYHQISYATNKYKLRKTIRKKNLSRITPINCTNPIIMRTRILLFSRDYRLYVLNLKYFFLKFHPKKWASQGKDIQYVQRLQIHTTEIRFANRNCSSDMQTSSPSIKKSNG